MIFIWIIKSSKEKVWQVYMAGVLGSNDTLVVPALPNLAG